MLFFSLVCTFKKAIIFFELKVDVQKRPLRFRGKLTIDVLVSFNLSYFFQMTCVLESYYYELHPTDEKMSSMNIDNDFLTGK